MTREEAIQNREDCLKYLEGIGRKASPECIEAVRWSVKALKALRPVSRERVDVVINSLKLRLENKVITNADRIRAMSDEELAKWLEYEGGGACAEVCGWLDWLQQPAEEDT